MDPLTHTATGVLLARAGLRRLTPRATLICIIAANIPDIDVATIGSGIKYLDYHRHLTHSLLAVPFMGALALVLAQGPARLFGKGACPLPWLRAWAAASVAALSHPLLDLTNPYGVRLGTPFSNRWYSLDIFSIIEPAVWAILLATTMVPALVGLVHSEIGDRPARTDRWAWAGLALLLAFAGGKSVLHQRAVATLDSYLYDGAPAVRVAAFPLPLNPWTWLGYVETERYHQISTVDLRQPYDPESGEKYYKPPHSPALETALKSKFARDYMQFARYAFVRVDPLPQGSIVRMADFRFPRGDRFGFQCTIQLDKSYRVLLEKFSFSGR